MTTKTNKRHSKKALEDEITRVQDELSERYSPLIPLTQRFARLIRQYHRLYPRAKP